MAHDLVGQTCNRMGPQQIRDATAIVSMTLALADPTVCAWWVTMKVNVSMHPF